MSYGCLGRVKKWFGRSSPVTLVGGIDEQEVTSATEDRQWRALLAAAEEREWQAAIAAAEDRQWQALRVAAEDREWQALLATAKARPVAVVARPRSRAIVRPARASAAPQAPSPA